MDRRRRGAATVFDASAILAVVNEEPGGEEVARRMEEPSSEPVVGAVNLSEVAAKLSERGVPPVETREAVGGLGLAVLPFDEEIAYRAFQHLSQPVSLSAFVFANRLTG